MSDSDDHKPETLAAQALGWVEPTTRALVPAIQPSTTFERDADNSYPAGRTYIRDHNVNFNQVEQLLARLEKGADAILHASGMASAVAVFQALPPGSRVVAPRVMYWGLRKWLVDIAGPAGLEVAFADLDDPAALTSAVESGCDLLWLETPANPLWTVTDIAHAVKVAHGVGARVAVDNTVATPVLTRPIELGADIVMHSATKYLNGHSDVLAGALVARDAEDSLWQRIRAGGRWRGACPARLRAGCCCAACAPCICACAPPVPLPRRLRVTSTTIRGWSRCSIPASPTIRAMMSRDARCRAVSAACCRSGSRIAVRVASRPRSRLPPGFACSSGQRRLAGWSRWWSIAPASKGRQRRFHLTCCAFPLVSRRLRT